DNLLSRFTRAGFLYALRAWTGALDAAATPPWQPCGVLQLADGVENETRVADTAVALAHPVEYASHVTRAEAAALAGRATAIGGWWFPMAGFVCPAAIVAVQLAHAARQAGTAPAVHLDRHVARLQRDGDRWSARDAAGAAIAAAPVVVLANACDAARLVDLGGDPLRRIRGQQTYLSAPPFAAPRVVVGGDGYVLPAVDGVAVTCATYDLARADQMALAGAHLAYLPRIRGLYGAFAFASRGLSWSALAAEALASELDAEPAPLSHALLDAIDPGRFVVKALRRGAL